jgi:cytidine deaminase
MIEMERLDVRLNLFRSSETELSGMDQELLVRARRMAATAYAPYSGFGVGAAVLLDDGQILTGNNQENAAYPSGLCAERVVLFHAGANFPGRKIRKLMIAIHSGKKEPQRVYAPCGGCRQVISEYETKQQEPIEILFEGPEGYITIAPGISDLLPFTFELKHGN